MVVGGTGVLQDVAGIFLDCLPKPEGDFTSTCALHEPGTGAGQSCAGDVSIRMETGRGRGGEKKK